MKLTRREWMGALGVLPLAAACKRLTSERRTMTQVASQEMPVLFAAHGAPMLLEDATWMRELAGWANALPKPKAILVISAHWDARPTTIGATRPVPLIYDFYGFPSHFYRLQYPCPGAPELAARVRDLLRARGLSFVDAPERGLDHGVYVPLMAMYERADIPVLQISMPGLDARKLVELGQAIGALRAEGVLIVGSGFLTHNMQAGFSRGVATWAHEFDDWAASTIASFDVDGLVDFQARAPSARMAHPTWEHYAPLLVAAGAASAGRHHAAFPITGFWNDMSFSRRSVQFG